MTPDPEELRYHIYVLRQGELVALASCSKDGVGVAIVQLHADGEFDDGERVGVLDRINGETGRWIISPFTRP